MAVVAEMYSLSWEVNGEKWRWRKRFFGWEKELVGECIGYLTLVVLQVEVWGHCVWKLQLSQCYMVSNAYKNLTKVEENIC